MSADAPTPDDSADVDDPSNIKQRRRIESLLDARDRVAEQHRKVLDLQANGQINQQLARRMLRQAVKEYALESEHVIKANLPDDSDPRDWSKKEDAAYHTWKECDLGVLEMQTAAREFTGVEDFLDAPRVITESWVETAASAVGGTEETVRSQQHEVPLDVSEAAYRALNYFWHEFGMDIEMETKRPFDDWAEDYEDGIYE